VVGVISDTHGLLRETALEALAGSGLIIHAGDIGKPGILERLQTIAPVVAVKGNVDKGGWASRSSTFFTTFKNSTSIRSARVFTS